MSEGIRECAADLKFLEQAGEVARIIAAYDWSSTSLGAISEWPLSLKSMIALVLRSPVAMAVRTGLAWWAWCKT
jgi:hypothetical protein